MLAYHGPLDPDGLSLQATGQAQHDLRSLDVLTGFATRRVRSASLTGPGPADHASAASPRPRTGAYDEQDPDAPFIVRPPSVEYSRRNWFDVLLAGFGPTRELAHRRVQTDLAHLFKVSNHYLSFFNIPLFVAQLNHPTQRQSIRASLSLSYHRGAGQLIISLDRAGPHLLDARALSALQLVGRRGRSRL